MARTPDPWADVKIMICRNSKRQWHGTLKCPGVNLGHFNILESTGDEALDVADALLAHLKIKLDEAAAQTIWKPAATTPVVEPDPEPDPEPEPDEDDDLASSPPAPEADYTAEHEARLAALPQPLTDDDQRRANAIRDFRVRQRLGGYVKPEWALWSEFTVRLADGQYVDVVYDPTWGRTGDTVRFEFHGPISVAGDDTVTTYQDRKKNEKKLGGDLAEWARRFAQCLANVVAKADQAKPADPAPAEAP